MTMTRTGITEAHPEEKHPGHAPLPPLGWPNPERYVGPNTKSKVPPVVRTVLTDEDMKQPDPLAQI
jgi:hypothetical protein